MSEQVNVIVKEQSVFFTKPIEKYELNIIDDSLIPTESLTVPKPIMVFLDIKKDGDGYVATSQKYYKYVGIGKTELEAKNSFKRLFEHKEYGEGLSNLLIEYVW